MNQLRTLLFVAFSLIAFLPTSSASAHYPILGNEATTVIPNLSTSYAFYRDLKTGEVDVYTFEGKAGQQLHAGMQIPAVKGLENYAVTMVLFGPGLPEADHDQLPPEHPEDLGDLIFLPKVTDDFFEPFTQTNYWGRQDIDMLLPETGPYYLIVWNPESQPGKYVLDTGRAEVFELADLFRFPVWWVQVQLFFGRGPYLLSGTAGLLAVIGAVIYRVRKRRS